MTSKPLVSIVTPSYNQAQYLDATIQSVLNQDYEHIEYIVMDGGSTDGSVEIIEQYSSRITHWRSEKDAGQTEAINKGFDLASGEIYAWLNSDDTYEPNAISAAVKYLQEHPEVGMVYGDANYIDANEKVIGRFPARQTDYRRLRQGYVHIPQQSSFWRASLWQQVAPLDIDYSFAMDYDLWLRLALISKIHYHPAIWANFRLHQESKTIAGDEGFWPEMIKIHQRNGGGRISIIGFKFYLRKMLAPLVTWRRRRRVGQAYNGEVE